MDIEFDKNIIELDSEKGVFNDNIYCDLSFDILDSIRNVIYIKIIKCSVIVKPLDALNNGSYIDNGDSVYFAVNDYSRITAMLNESIHRIFETVDIDLTQTYNITADTNYESTKGILYSKEYSQLFHKDDISVYKLNPIEPVLKRFNVVIYDKNGEKMARDDIVRFKILLCVYSNNKKF